MSSSLSDLIEKIYGTALAPADWQDVSADLANSFNGTSALLLYDLRQASLAMDINHGYEESYVASYRSHFATRNPLTMSRWPKPPGTVTWMYDIVSERSLARSEMFNDWMLPQNLPYCIGLQIPIGTSAMLFVSLLRERRDYDQDDAHRFGALFPHLQRALAIGERLQQQTSVGLAARTALTQLGIAALVLSRDGVVIDASERAEALLQQGVGLSIQLGRLALADAAQTSQLRILLRTTIDTRHAQEMVLVRGEHAMTATLVCVPSTTAIFGDPTPRVLMLLRRVGDNLPPSSRLRLIYGLTNAESRLVDALVAGRSLAEYCDEQQVSRNTVKTQLQSVFQKTGVSRQAGLVRLALGMIAAPD